MSKTPRYSVAGPRTPMRRMAGVSLMELMAVVAIVGILMGVGIPTYKSITAQYRVSSEINALLGDMQYGRSEAIKQGQNVVICVSTDGITCNLTNTNWNVGWVVFVDPSANNAKSNSSAARVLRAGGPFKSGDTMTDSTTSAVTFDREGLALGLLTTNSGAGGALIPLHDPTSNAVRTRCLQVTNVGNVSVQQPSTTAGCT